MKGGPQIDELLSLWCRSIEAGIDAWRAALGQAGTPDLGQLWGPMFGQFAEAWTRALQAGGSSPEVLTHWKVLMETAVEAWAKVIGDAMATEGFAALLGKSLDEYIRLAGPARKTLAAANEEFLRTMNLPSRMQMTSLASQVAAMEARLEAIEEQVETIADRVAQAPPAQPSRPVRAGSPKPRNSSRRTPRAGR